MTTLLLGCLDKDGASENALSARTDIQMLICVRRRVQVGMVLSRAFTVDGVPRMLPFVDMLNHHPSAGKITINAEDTTIPEAAARNQNVDTDQHLDDSQTNVQQRQPQRVTLSAATQHSQQRKKRRREEMEYDSRHQVLVRGAGDRHVIADHDSAVGTEYSNQMQTGNTGEIGKTVRTWSKRALAITDTDTGSTMSMGRLEDGAAVEWAYKSFEASNFDLLYLYGFVSAHPSHAFFPLRMEWAASSPEEAQRAHSLFVKAAVEKTSSPSVEILSPVAAPALALTLRFRADGGSKSDVSLSLLHCHETTTRACEIHLLIAIE